jgi:uncharacterized paraquat-inducible protein A
MSKKETLCFKCKTKVDFTKVSPDYYAYCPECDEDLYKFETVIQEKSYTIMGYKIPVLTKEEVKSLN